MSVRNFRQALIEAASAPYRSAGRFAWHFARGKLDRDPAFWGMLERGLVPNGDRLLDLGCGQGLLASWLLSARACHDAGIWPDELPAAPRLQSLRGIELMIADVRRARTALGGRAEVAVGDIRSAAYGRADVVVLLDVLHYLPPPDQDAVLQRVRAALEPAGVLLMRVGDPGGGLSFRIGKWVDQVMTFARGHRLSQLHFRPLADWQCTLAGLGFRVEAVPMSAGTPFANVLLVARL